MRLISFLGKSVWGRAGSAQLGTGAMLFVGTQKKLPKKERGRKEKGEDYIISHLIKSSH